MATSKVDVPAEVKHVLAHADTFGFRMGVWYIIDAPDAVLETDPDGTLAARFRLSAAAFQSCRKVLGISIARQASWHGPASPPQSRVLSRNRIRRPNDRRRHFDA